MSIREHIQQLVESRFFGKRLGPFAPLLASIFALLFALIGVIAWKTIALSVILLVIVNTVVTVWVTDCGQPLGLKSAKSSANNNSKDPVVVILGGGQAGLAQAATLQRRGVPYVVLEKEADTGTSWSNRYDRLHLHTDKFLSTMPYVDFPSSFPLYPSREQVAAFLRGYWRMLSLNVRFNCEVVSFSREGSGAWSVVLKSGEVVRAPMLVVAYGEPGTPNTPTLPGEKEFRGTLVHSINYKNGSQYSGKRVLVVGFGNSGMEISLDLVENGAASVTTAFRGPIAWMDRDFIPNKVPGIWPTLALGAHFWPTAWVDKVGSAFLLDSSKVGGTPFTKSTEGVFSNIERCKSPLLDIGFGQALRDRRLSLVEADSVKSLKDFDVVIKATGYTRALRSTLPNSVASAVLDADDLPKKNHFPDLGLSFVGYRDRMGRFRQTSFEAEENANVIAAQWNATTSK